MTKKVWETSGGSRVCFHCPGCEYAHCLIVKDSNSDLCWTWNGSLEKPTFEPSLLVTIPEAPEHGIKKHVCHSFIREGRIQFLSDSTHKLAGQTVEMPDDE